MSEAHRAFSERLIQLEHVSPALRAHYDQELLAIHEKQVTGIRRWSWLIAAGWGLICAIGFGGLAVLLPADFPWVGRAGFAIASLFGIGWVILGLRIYRRGTIRLRADSGLAMQLGTGISLVVAIVLLIGAPENLGGLRAVVNGLAFLIMGTWYFMRYLADQSELRTREQLLRIELQIAELGEHLRGNPPASSR